MTKTFFTIILACAFLIGFGQNGKIKLREYLNPRGDSMTFNCVYNSFHADGLHDTITLIFRKINIENRTAYCISTITDTSCGYSDVSSFLGSAMIFTNDSILLAPLKWEESAYHKKLQDFKYFIPSSLKWTDTLVFRLYDRRITLLDFKIEKLKIDGQILENCLRIKIIEEFRNAIETATEFVWLNKTYGIVKWIRGTGRIEVRDLRSLATHQ